MEVRECDADARIHHKILVKITNTFTPTVNAWDTDTANYFIKLFNI